MKKKSRKIVVIVGPTASGKSDLAKILIRKFNGVAISADSRQVYRGMDIGTGKDKSFFQYMVDIRDPDEDYSVAEFQLESNKLIDKIISEGKIPFVVGGTGLYINALIYGFQFPKTDKKLREKIENYSTEKLLQELSKFDPVSAEKNKDNHRRLARALESYLVNARPLSKYKKKKPNFEYIMLCIDSPREELYKRIDARVDERIKDGMIEEVEKLLKNGIPHKRLQRFGLEYRYIDDYIVKLKSQNSNLKTNNQILKQKSDELKNEMIQKLKFKIHAFARRQLTWFRKNKEICWLSTNKEIEQYIVDYLI